MNKRVTELETRLAFQDQTIQELNEALIDQQRQIDGLREELERLREQIGASGVSNVASPSEETPPPHY